MSSNMFALQFIQSPCVHLVFAIFTLAANFPMLLGADDYRHSSCRTAFQCGRIKEVTYPFWGGDRSNYCGHPDFKLDCSNDDDPEIEINSRYRILDINQKSQTLRIGRSDAWDGVCSLRMVNTTLNFGIVRFSRTNVNLTLFYLCPPTRISPDILICKLDENVGGFQIAFSSEPQQMNMYRGCRVSIEIPVIKETVENHNFDPATVENVSIIEEVLKGGFDVDYDGNATYCSECKASGGQCGYNWTTLANTCFCTYGLEQKLCNAIGSSLRLKVVIGTTVGVGIVFVLALLFVFRKRLHSSNFIIFWNRENKTQRLVEDFLEFNGSLVPKRYSYNDLKKITSSFKDKIGQGGYGEVYKGELVDGRLVAVKLLNDGKGTDGQEFINEVASISRTSHVNIVNLLGFCFHGSKRALVYEFMANGSLEKFIYGRPIDAQPHLGWETLFQVAVGVARGLEYLHRGCNTRILHFDIKPHNILLDIDFTPKISDFGLAKLCPRNESIISMLDARGTVGYIAPEMFNRQFGGVSHKSDVYSYGMMVLEVIGKRKNVDEQVNNTSEIYFPEWIYDRLELGEDLGLNGIMSAEDAATARKLMLVALWCIQTNPISRPAMTRVMEMLEGTHELLSVPPKPYLCSPPRSPQSPISSSTT